MPAHAHLRSFLTLLTFSVWFGGFTFYAAVVVPIGTEVLGSATAQGFVTSRVTVWLNVLCALCLTILAWDACHRTTRRSLNAAVIAIMALIVVSLFFLHPQLLKLLDSSERSVLEPDRFYALHRVYLILSSALWLGGLIWLALAVKGRSSSVEAT